MVYNCASELWLNWHLTLRSSPMPPPMLSLMGASSFELLKLNGGFGPVAIMLVTCGKKWSRQKISVWSSARSIEIQKQSMDQIERALVPF